MADTVILKVERHKRTVVDREGGCLPVQRVELIYPHSRLGATKTQWPSLRIRLIRQIT